MNNKKAGAAFILLLACVLAGQAFAQGSGIKFNSNADDLPFPSALRLIGDAHTFRHTHDSDALVMADRSKSQVVGFSLMAGMRARGKEF